VDGWLFKRLEKRTCNRWHSGLHPSNLKSNFLSIPAPAAFHRQFPVESWFHGSQETVNCHTHDFLHSGNVKDACKTENRLTFLQVPAMNAAIPVVRIILTARAFLRMRRDQV
jgi:hypothetical protein